MEDKTIILEDSSSLSGETLRMDIENTKTKIFTDTASSGNEPEATPMNIYELNGVAYRLIKIISESSGESQVYKIEHEKKPYVLKLYYPHLSPKQELQKIIKNMNFEMIVKVYDYGRITLGSNTRAFEIMEYLQGGSLENFQLHQNTEIFKKIALSAAAALFFCHQNNIIHKDIKPGNFFFRDTEHQQLVLGDFGISSLMTETDLLHKTTQARTPIYAAPEMYTNVIDGEVEITASVDFYSLGITLLYLWLGRNPFSGNERAMMRMKQEGKLPQLDLLPSPVKMLIQGLTAIQPDKRWGYEEIKRWYKGEKVEVYTGSPFVKYTPFVFDHDQSLIAGNTKELAVLLHQNPELGIKYLYNRKIVQWLENCGNTKLAVELEEITEKRFPLNQTAGISAAIYLLDPQFPYYDVNGKVCISPKELADSLLNNRYFYEQSLQDENQDFYLFLESKKEIKTAERFRKYFATLPPPVALGKIIYEMSPGLPFLREHPSSNIKEIIAAFSSGKCSEDEWRSLTDGRLLSWLSSQKEPVIYKDVELLTQGQPYSVSLAYGVLYHLDRECGFDLKTSVTCEQIGHLMSTALQEAQEQRDEELPHKLEDFIGKKSKLFYYCKAHQWEEILKFKERCLDLHSKENQERYGAYSLRIACYKFCAGIGYTPGYFIKDKNIILYSLKEMEKQPKEDIVKEMKFGCLKSWLTLFFHENCRNKFENQYDYEKSLQNYLLKVGTYDASDHYYKRFSNASTLIQHKLRTTKHLFRNTCISEFIWIFLLAISSISLLFLIQHYGISNVTIFRERYYDSVCLPIVSIGLFISVRRVLYNNDFFIGILIIILESIIWISPALVAQWLMYKEIASAEIICTLTFSFYLLIFYISGFRHSVFKQKQLRLVFQQNLQSTLLEPLHYTYKTTSTKFQGSNFKALDTTQQLLQDIRRQTLVPYAARFLLISIFIGLFIYFHPQLYNGKLPKISLNRTVESLEINEYINKIVEETK